MLNNGSLSSITDTENNIIASAVLYFNYTSSKLWILKSTMPFEILKEKDKKYIFLHGFHLSYYHINI